MTMKKLTRSQLIKNIDKLVSMRVRYGSATRDKEGTFWCTCISCGRKLPLSMVDCGHFIARGCLPLRFDLGNVKPECQRCNRFSPDHLTGYAYRIVKDKGERELNRLVRMKEEWRQGKIKPFTMAQLKDIYNDNLKAVRRIEEKWNIKLLPKTWVKL